MDFEEAIVRAMRAERAISGLTIAQLAERSGVNERSLERYLKGQRPLKIETIYALAVAMNRQPSDVMVAAEQIMGRPRVADLTEDDLRRARDEVRDEDDEGDPG